jgi:hypothetical protein
MKVEVKRLELTDELVKYGIIDVYYNNEKIEIIYTRQDSKEDVITLYVGKYAHDTINQLDSLINGSMSLESFTQLKYYLTLKLTPIWDQIYVSTTKTKTKIQEKTLEQELRDKYHFKSLKDTKEIYY